MTVLVIPDIHLKDFMFERAHEIMESEKIDQAVCLMDIPDDWDKQYREDLYHKIFDAAENFQKLHQTTLWCYGNHDLCYLWDQRESGYSLACADAVRERLHALQKLIPDENLAVVHVIDNVIFSHAGVSANYVRDLHINEYRTPIEEIVDIINKQGPHTMWTQDSPIWLRVPTSDPLRGDFFGQSTPRMYQQDTHLQVVGHTPVSGIISFQNILFCDTFSTYRDGKPIGTQEFLILDTKTWKRRAVK